ncbi:VOC family protein [Limnochorda pilosa]|nr:VOC family protein [Limnochorda pilosa]
MGTLPLDLDDLLAVAAATEGGADPGTRVGHVHLNVADLERSRRFYCDLLGFDVMLRYGPSALFISVGGYHHHLGFNTWEGEGALQPPARSTGLVSYVLWVPPEGFDSLVDRLKEAGAPFSTVDIGRFASSPADPRRQGTSAGNGGPGARAGDPMVDAGARGVELTDPDGIGVVLAVPA